MGKIVLAAKESYKESYGAEFITYFLIKHDIVFIKELSGVTIHAHQLKNGNKMNFRSYE